MRTRSAPYPQIGQRVGDGRPAICDRAWQAVVWLRRRRMVVRPIGAAVLIQGRRVAAADVQRVARAMGWPG